MSRRFATTGRGYSTEQSTRPQTLGYSLADSPVGLLAWIYEKLVAWTDKYPWTEDEGTLELPPCLSHLTDDSVYAVNPVLEWISIYWFSRSGPAASLRIYYEMTNGGTLQLGTPAGWTPVPLGVSYFPGELAQFPK